MLPDAAGRSRSRPHRTPADTLGLFRVSLLGLSLLFAGGCSTYNDEVAAARQNWSAGLWERSAAIGTKLSGKEEGHRNEVLLGLEEGTLLRAVDRIDESNDVFESTWNRIEEMDREAEVRISQAGLALLVNPGLTIYRARTYDRIMLHTYAALNSLILQDPASARVSLNRAYNAQQRAVEENSKRIEKLQNEIEKEHEEDDDSTVDLERIADDPTTRSKIDSLYQPVRNMEPYAPYVNPFSVYLDALYFLNLPADASDLERGLKSMERVSSLNPQSDWLRREYRIARDIVAGKGQPDSVIVLFETGLSPARKAETLELPLFLFGSGSVPYFAAAFPVLRFQEPFPRYLEVEAGGATATTGVIADMDRVIAQEFRDHESLVVTQALLAGATKAAAFYIARSQAKDNSTLQAIIDITGIFYQAATNQPDLRTWFTLPKQIQGVRLPRPEDGILTLSFPSSNQRVEVPLESAKISVVLVRVTTTPINPVIQQFVLQ